MQADVLEELHVFKERECPREGQEVSGKGNRPESGFPEKEEDDEFGEEEKEQVFGSYEGSECVLCSIVGNLSPFFVLHCQVGYGWLNGGNFYSRKTSTFYIFYFSF